MEDNLAANRDTYRKGTTDKNGAFTISGVANGKYFVYVEPSDRDHLPGGDLSNKAMPAEELAKKSLAIQVSGKAPENATYVGSSRCLLCHKDFADLTKTLHKLGILLLRLRQGPRLRQVSDLRQAAGRSRHGQLHRHLLQGRGRHAQVPHGERQGPCRPAADLPG